MTKCEYCGKKICFFSVMYSRLDKEKDTVIHDKCLMNWEGKNPDKMEEIEKLFQMDDEIFNQIEMPKKQFNFLKEIYSKRLIYLFIHHPEIHTNEEIIKWYEDEIEEIKKDDNYPDKEKTLKEKNDRLIFLKYMKENKIVD